MTKAELIEFRRKLVRAKMHAKSLILTPPWLVITEAFELSGLQMHAQGTNIFASVPPHIFDWFCDKRRTNKERTAMWDNSIAHVDKLIAEAK